MKYELNTILCLIEGGNKYKVTRREPTQGSEFKGCYQVECIDFWCPEDLGDGIMCWREGEKLWVASFFTDFMIVWQTAKDFEENGLK